MKFTTLSLTALAGLCLSALFSLIVPTRGQSTSAPAMPTLYLIGDSTVKNGHDTGSNGQWGWGHLLPAYFDLSRINVVNDAAGGTSSRTFFQSANLWPATLAKVHAGDFVMMQFGHNDNTAAPEEDNTRWRSTIKGNGEETVQGLTKTGTETVHSFGWYIRQYIAQTEAKGATPIVCSLIPRNSWGDDGKIGRADQSYGLWAKEAVEQANKESAAAGSKIKAFFLPLNTIICDHYDQMGEEAVKALFPPAPEHTHTNWAGAKLNAQSVAEGVKAFPDCPLSQYLAATPAEMAPPATMPAK